MSQTYKTAGTVIKSRKLGEADKIITLLTEIGLVTAVAKGVRRVKSKFGGRLEPGNDLDLVLARGRSLDTITQVNISRLRVGIRSNLKKIQAMYAILELAEKFATEISQDDRMLRLVSAALDQLEVDQRTDLLVLAFDIKMLAINGMMPTLSRCVKCGGSDDLDSFSVSEGGVLCPQCRAGARTIKAPRGAIDLINDLLRLRFNELDTKKTSKRIIEVAQKMIEEHIDFHGQAELKARGPKNKE